ncbi:hypothetical protein GOODEAATRI_010396 [Goodea atripinnis]|uniref:PheRS DNA binding domain-containing protein n=1 Tax=Goodea atripinnis TaxID=208336 RepID=A0ABV0PWW9_9TELE
MNRCFDVTSCLFRALQGFSMADTGVVETLLQRIEKLDGGVDSLGVAASLGVDHQVIVGAVKSLQALGDVSVAGMRVSGMILREGKSFLFSAVQVISAELRSSKHWELTEEGTEIAEQGSHEARVFNSILLEGLPQAELMVRWTSALTGVKTSERFLFHSLDFFINVLYSWK